MVLLNYFLDKENFTLDVLAEHVTETSLNISISINISGSITSIMIINDLLL